MEQTRVEQLKQIDTELKRLSSIEAEFDWLNRELGQAATILDTHVKRAAEAQMNADLDASEQLSSMKVLQAATLPIRPVFPQVPLFLALGGVLSLVCAAAACLMPELFARDPIAADVRASNEHQRAVGLTAATRSAAAASVSPDALVPLFPGEAKQARQPVRYTGL
ncbi:MAG: hypothetical protein AB7E84_20895 [Xanthobacteraceae bacterium]